MKNLIVTRHANPLSLWDSFDRLFDGFVTSNAGRNVRQPAVDVREDSKQYVLEAELPGYNESDVKIKVEDNLLVIEADVRDEKEAKDEGWLIRERAQYGFRRSFALPKDVDADKIEATFANGILTLTVPKSEKAQPKVIAVKRG